MASRNGTSRIERCLPKSLRMRFFSVNEYVVIVYASGIVGTAGVPGKLLIARKAARRKIVSWKPLVLPAPARLSESASNYQLGFLMEW